MRISEVLPQDAPAVLAKFAPQIKRALASGQGDAVTAEDMLADILDGRSSVWAAHEGDDVRGVCVLSINQYRTGRKVYVQFLAGQGMDAWADAMEAALLKCQGAAGAMCVEGSCRPGLARYLKRRGWKVKAVIMEAPK